MRIVFLAWRDRAHSNAGGSEVVVDQLARHLTARGHDVTLLAGGPHGPNPYRSISTGGTYVHYLRTPASFLRRRLRADVVVDVENGVPYFSPLWQRAPVVGLVHHVHTEQWAMQFRPPIAAFGRFVEGRAMPRIYRRRRVVAVSASTAADLVQIGFDPDRIEVIEMGVEVPETPPAPRAETPRFVVLSRLVPHKRVEKALEAWETVRPVVGGELVVIGDGPERGRLERLAGADVRFLGTVSDAEKDAALSSAWILVHPAHHEGWGTVVMEAASFGTPSLAYRVRGVRDSVVDGETGILVDDDAAFADAWIHLASDEERRSRMSAAARTRALSFSWARSAEAFEKVLVRSVDEGG
jgi:glycosyltransferase involved in cell wall biosynthesis